MYSATSVCEYDPVVRSPIVWQIGSDVHIDIDCLKSHYTSKGNMINYVATIIDGEQRQESAVAIKHEVLKNLYTAVVEHPFADSIGEYHYSNQWKVTPDGLRLRSDSDYLDSIINRAVVDTTGQVPQFEKSRNIQDSFFLQKLTLLRSLGYYGDVVKFSPSPEDIVNPEVRRRGYSGNDQISIFHCNSQTFTESVSTFWFPQAPFAAYQELFTRLQEEQVVLSQGIILPHSWSDITIMEASGRPTPPQMEHIREFVDSRRKTILARGNDILEYADTVIKPKVEAQLLPIIERVATQIQQGSADESVILSLEEAFAQLSDLQFELRLYIRDRAGFNTFVHCSDACSVSYDQYVGAGGDERNDMIKLVGYQASGCGFDGSEDFGQKGAIGFLWGISSIFSLGGRSELYTFVCPRCYTIHAIDVPRGIYVDFCVCGFDARC